MGPIHAPNPLVPHGTACCQPHTLAAMPRPQPQKNLSKTAVNLGNCCCGATSHLPLRPEKPKWALPTQVTSSTPQLTHATSPIQLLNAMCIPPCTTNRNSTRCREHITMKSAICKCAPALRDVRTIMLDLHRRNRSSKRLDMWSPTKTAMECCQN